MPQHYTCMMGLSDSCCCERWNYRSRTSNLQDCKRRQKYHRLYLTSYWHRSMHTLHTRMHTPDHIHHTNTLRYQGYIHQTTYSRPNTLRYQGYIHQTTYTTPNTLRYQGCIHQTTYTRPHTPEHIHQTTCTRLHTPDQIHQTTYTRPHTPDQITYNRPYTLDHIHQTTYTRPDHIH